MVTRATRIPARVEFTGNRQVDEAQRNAHEALRAANNVSASATKRTDAFAFTAGGTQQIVHGLQIPSGGTPIGWRVIDVTGGYSSFLRTAWDSKTITIQAENACTASFEVFA